MQRNMKNEKLSQEMGFKSGRIYHRMSEEKFSLKYSRVEIRLIPKATSRSWGFRECPF